MPVNKTPSGWLRHKSSIILPHQGKNWRILNPDEIRQIAADSLSWARRRSRRAARFISLCSMPSALCAFMNSRKENLITILLILLGVIIVPVLFIWSADTIFALTIKTFVAAFFLLLLIRAFPRQKDEPHHRQSIGKDEESWEAVFSLSDWFH